MSKEEIKNIVHMGDLIACSRKEYDDHVRRYLHECASEYIDDNDFVRMTICLQEVRRLDERLGFTLC